MDRTEASWLGLLERARQLGPDPGLVGLSDADVEREVRDGAARIAASTCWWLLFVAELVVRGTWDEQGARTPGQWLSWACGVAPGTAREHVRVGLALRSAPLVRARFAAGTLSYSKVRAITRVVAPEVEQVLVELADAAPAAQLERIVRESEGQLAELERWRDGPPGTDQDVADRWEMDVRHRGDGRVEVRVVLPAADAEALAGRLDRLVELADRTEDTEPHTARVAAAVDREPVGARRARALVDAVADTVARGGPDRSGDDDHLVVLHVPADQLAHATRDAPERPGRPGRTRVHVVSGRDRGMRLPASVLARLTCDGQVRLAPHGPEGQVHDVGRACRSVPTRMRRALRLRDRHCRFPGCDTTRHLHAHHVVHWADGGPTDMANLVLLCGFHHRFVHDRHWTLRPVAPDAGWWDYLAPGATTPLAPADRLPGVPAGTPDDRSPPPSPDALQPRWWDGQWDPDETIHMVTTYLDTLVPPPRIPTAA